MSELVGFRLIHDPERDVYIVMDVFDEPGGAIYKMIRQDESRSIPKKSNESKNHTKTKKYNESKNYSKSSSRLVDERSTTIKPIKNYDRIR